MRQRSAYTVTKHRQLCPTTGEWWALFWNATDRVDLEAASLDDLTMQHRIIAWAIVEQWEDGGFDDCGPIGGKTSVVAIIADGTLYCAIPNVLREVVPIEESQQWLGYFTTDDLQNEATVATIRHAAIEAIQESRTPKKQPVASKPSVSAGS
jgi:hypothetical protein